MADTGAPWNIPFAEPSDLVRDWPDLSEDVANAVAAGLDAAGGLVAVKHVLKTDAFSASVASGGNVAITGTNALSITHEVADPANRLIISAYFGLAASSTGRGNVGIAVAVDGTLVGIGDAAGSRTRVGAGGWIAANVSGVNVTMPSITFVHTPGAGSKTYTVRAINIDGSTRTLYVNQMEDTTDAVDRSRGASALVIQEVKV